MLRLVVEDGSGSMSGFTPQHYVVPLDIAAEFDSIEIVEGKKRTVLAGLKASLAGPTASSKRS